MCPAAQQPRPHYFILSTPCPHPASDPRIPAFIRVLWTQEENTNLLTQPIAQTAWPRFFLLRLMGCSTIIPCNECFNHIPRPIPSINHPDFHPSRALAVLCRGRNPHKAWGCWESVGTISTRVLALLRPECVEIRIPSSRKLMKNAFMRQLFLGVNFERSQRVQRKVGSALAAASAGLGSSRQGDRPKSLDIL